ncbi:MAG: hypothetical protein IJ309_01810 [Clostridia bacterium]|nr:hypothetical protein [Clostridia bacterium]
MNRKIKLLMLLLLAFICVVVVCSCNEPPYTQYDNDGYNVSIRFDANGGRFGEDKTYTLVDSYNIENLPLNENGMKEIYLVKPDSANRVENRTPQLTNYLFTGEWFTKRTPVVNDKGEALDYYGEVASVSGRMPAYTYEDRWDFSKPLEVDPNKEHSSYSPEITLYAGWIPYFQIEFKDNETKELIETKLVRPTESGSIIVPAWNYETGEMDLGFFPQNEGKTYVASYIDGNQITEEAIAHIGSYDLVNATYENEKMVVYVDYKDGEWYKISKPEQLSDIWNPNGIYEILEDLNFAPVNEYGEVENIVWPFTNNTFTGKIIGNGHTISGVSIEQSGTSNQVFGLFGALNGATIENITFNNIYAYIGGGTRLPATSFGLFAGTVSGSCTFEGVAVTNSKLCIYLGANFAMTDDYSIGLLCGVDSGTALEDISFDITLDTATDEFVLEYFVPTLGQNGNTVVLVLVAKE